MKIIDYRVVREDLPAAVDILVVGSGPAGLTVASELVGAGLSVLVVESGGLEPDPRDISVSSSIGSPRVAPESLVRIRALGGTSVVWSGRCTPLDDIDFENRDWVPDSGWPITPADVDDHLGRAAEYFRLGVQEYGDGLWAELRTPPPLPKLDPGLLTERFWHFSRGVTDPSAPTRFGADIRNDVHVLLNATVVRLENSDGRVTAAHLADRNGRGRRISVGRVVLAAGAIETPRLLLASGLGNNNTGRYFMDHPGVVIAQVPTKGAVAIRNRFGLYWKTDQPFRRAFMNGIALSPAVQRSEKLLNAAAWLDEYPAVDDPWQAGIRLVRRLRGEQVKSNATVIEYWRERSGTAAVTPTVLGDVMAIVRHPLLIAQGLLRLRRHRPPLYLPERVDLYCLVEQLPDRDSRITLSDINDERGMPIARVDWRLHEEEFTTMKRFAELVGEEFERVGLPVPVASPWMTNIEDWRKHVLDRAHQIGTTRMAAGPADGVVDVDCRVFGVENVFIAGSSVFPTSGHANPTLMIVALAIRLADHLREPSVTKLRVSSPLENTLG